jgi:hypothetical protein
MRHAGLRTRQHPGHTPQNREDGKIENPRGRIQRLPEFPHTFRHVFDVRHPLLGMGYDLLDCCIGYPDLLCRLLEQPEGSFDVARKFFKGFYEFPDGPRQHASNDNGNYGKTRKKTRLESQAKNPLFVEILQPGTKFRGSSNKIQETFSYRKHC